MDKLIANLDTINNCSLELDEKSRYFASKKSTFSAYSFGSCATLSNFLRELQTSYTNTSLNIKEVYQVLDQFSQDVEALERKASYGYGYVSLENVNSLLSGLATSIKEVVIDSANLFEIMSYDSALDGGILSGVVDAYFTFQSTRAVWVLSFLEGVLNIGEMIVDAGAMAVSAGASLLGFDDASNSINNFIAADWTREGYNAVVDKTGISDYSLIDPNGTIANLCSMGGTITGMIVISILTAGAGGAAAGAGAGAGAAAAGVTTSTVTTATLQAAVGAATALGSESEAALQNGATAGEAFAAGGIAAVVGALFGAVGGVFDDAARAATGVGEVVKNSLASFFVNTLEPLINEATNTLIYKNDGTGFWDNFTTNFVSDGVLLNMLLSGGTNAAGTAINGMIGLRANSASIVDTDASRVNSNNVIGNLTDAEITSEGTSSFLTNAFFETYGYRENGYGVNQGIFREGKSMLILNDEWLKGHEADMFNYLVNVRGLNETTALAGIKYYSTPNSSLTINGIGIINSYLTTVIDDPFEIAKIMSGSFSTVQENAIYSALKNKLVSQGMNGFDAVRTLDLVDSSGACSYAAVANEIFDSFMRHPNKFEEYFGYSMYTNVDGHKVLNYGELLLDLYVFVNSNLVDHSVYSSKPPIFNIENGKISINNINAGQRALSGGMGRDSDVVNLFLQSKNPSLSCTTHDHIYSSTGSFVAEKSLELDDLKAMLNTAVDNDVEISLGIYKKPGHVFNFYNASTRKLYINTNNWNEGGAHAVYVTEVLDDGVIVSSWGKKLFIPFTDFINGRYNIIFSEYGGINS